MYLVLTKIIHIRLQKSNDEILKQLYARNKSVVSFNELNILGFNFQYLTKLILEENKVVGSEYFFSKLEDFRETTIKLKRYECRKYI